MTTYIVTMTYRETNATYVMAAFGTNAAALAYCDTLYAQYGGSHAVACGIDALAIDEQAR